MVRKGSGSGKINRPGRLPRGAERLLDLLATPGVTVLHDVDLPDELQVVKSMNGLTVPQGRIEAAAGHQLVDEDLAVWIRAGTRRHLRISPAGLAWLARHRSRADLSFAAQHHPLSERPIGDGRSAVVNDGESPLAWLHRRRGRDGRPLIDAAAFAAGERLRSDLTAAGLMPRVTSDWSQTIRGGAGGPAAATDHMIAARQRVRAAMSAVGPAMADLLIDVCGFLKSLSEVEHDRGWPSRSAKVVLNLALDQLCDHYGIEREVRGRASSPGIALWLSEDEMASRAVRRIAGQARHRA